jgi:uncharacterized protein YecE (DUF72 family)
MEVVPPSAPIQRSVTLAERMPPRVRLGTSSWSFPGWRGLVYAESAPAAALAAEGLAAYAHQALHRTVGLDRAFYEVPSVATLRALADQVPPGFRFVVKAHQALTRPHLQADGSTRGSTLVSQEHGAPNPRFLDAAWACDAVISPLQEGLGRACGPVVFQFPALAFGPRGPLADENQLIDRLSRFLQGLPSGICHAVEFRNASFLKGRVVSRLVQALQAANAVPAIGLLPGMPACAEAAAALQSAGWRWSPERPLVLRWLLGHGLGYEEARARFEPFREAVAPDPASRGQVADLAAQAESAGAEAFVIVNNKAEGSAPRSVAMLAEAIVERMHRATPPARKETMS